MNSPKAPKTRALLAALLVAMSVPAMVACTTSEKHQSAGDYIDDATITTRVKTALAQDSQVRVSQVNVETFNGVVQLSGFVDSTANAARAADLARGVKGVRSVKNDLRLKPN